MCSLDTEKFRPQDPPEHGQLCSTQQRGTVNCTVPGTKAQIWRCFCLPRSWAEEQGLLVSPYRFKALGLVTNTAEDDGKGKYVWFGAMVSTFAAGTFSKQQHSIAAHIYCTGIMLQHIYIYIYIYICFCVQVRLGVFDQIYFQRFPFETRMGCKIVLV